MKWYADVSVELSMVPYWVVIIVIRRENRDLEVLERPAAKPREFVFRVVVMHQLQYCNAECRS